MSEFSAFRNGGSYTLGKITKTNKEYEKNEARERKRNLLYLIVSYLRDQNLHESADALANEAQLGIQFEVCDNIDLDIMYQDFESFYFTKFNKTPKIIKKATLQDNGSGGRTTLLESQSAGQKRKQKSCFTSGHPPSNSASSNVNPPTPGRGVASPRQTVAKTLASDFQIDVTSLTQKHSETNEVSGGSPGATVNSGESSEPWPRRPLCEFEGYNPEWREFAELVVREFVPKNLGITWRDCIGVNRCIDLLKEAVVYPLKYPELFNGLIEPWKGILLYGPPGTGKTLLAKALACETSTTFINVSSSSFISKWRGESEKMIKVMFDVARFYAPSTIFIDEIDAIASKFEDAQHDASRRFKSELLVQLDGLLSGEEKIFVLATTNSPWNLDSAILRRFEKRILLQLPSEQSRIDLFKHFLRDHPNNLQESDYKRAAQVTENYSASDIKLVCKEVVMELCREKLAQIQKNKAKSGSKTPDLQLKKFTVVDVVNAVEKINPASDPELAKKYVGWDTKYGSS